MSKSLEQRLAEAATSEEIRDLCVQAGELSGTLVRERDGSVTVRDTVTQHPPEPQPEPQADTLLRRAVRIGNTVTLLEAYSPTGLDILERRLRDGH